MSRILVIGEHDGQHIQQSTARCLNCAQQIEATGADVVIFAAAGTAVAAEAAELGGVKRVLLVEQAMRPIFGNSHRALQLDLPADFLFKRRHLALFGAFAVAIAHIPASTIGVERIIPMVSQPPAR